MGKRIARKRTGDPLFLNIQSELKFIAIMYTSVLKYNKAYFKKVSKVYVTVYGLSTFRKSMLLYQGKRKKAGNPREKGNRNLLRKRQEERNTRTQNKIKPEDLSEADTDLSSMLKMNGHAETIQRIFEFLIIK